MVFAGYTGFLHYLQLASHKLATIGINVTKNKIQIQNSKEMIPDTENFLYGENHEIPTVLPSAAIDATVEKLGLTWPVCNPS